MVKSDDVDVQMLEESNKKSRKPKAPARRKTRRPPSLKLKPPDLIADHLLRTKCAEWRQIFRLDRNEAGEISDADTVIA